MITGELKHKIDSLWEMFWTGGLTNPLDVVEQMTYLMFIRDLDDTDRLRAREAAMLGLPHESIFAGTVKIGEREVEGDLLRWSKFQDIGAEQMYETVQTLVFPFIKGLHGNKESAYSKYMDDAIFKLPPPLLLSKVVDGLNEIYRLMAQNPGSDMRGDTYEYLLSKIAQSGVNGQFRTPRHIIRMMVELMAPQPTDTICDPACGTAGFLVASAEYIRSHYEDTMTNEQWEHFSGPMFTGFDTDRTMLCISAMNLMLHSIHHPDIRYRDSVSKENTVNAAFTMCLANPPFKGSINATSISDSLKAVTSTKKTELLFLALFLRMLKKGGQCACIVPDGVLFGSSKAHQSIRRELVEHHQLRAVISMPSGVSRMRASPPPCSSSPKPRQAARITSGSTTCRPTAFLWTTSALPWIRTTFPTSSLALPIWKRKRTEPARNSPSLCPRRRSWPTATIFPSTSTSRWNMLRWNILPRRN